MRVPRARPALQFLVVAPLLMAIVALAPRAENARGGPAAAPVLAAAVAGGPAMAMRPPTTLRGGAAGARLALAASAAPVAPANEPPGGTSAETAAADRPAEETRAAAVEEQQPLPLFYEHRVVEGETVSDIAVRYGVTTDDILWNNIDILVDADMLTIGTVLQVPSVSGVIHAVRVGETVSEIAVRYDAEIADIVAFPANGFDGDADTVREGALILVPGGRPPPPPPPPAAEAPAAPDAPPVVDAPAAPVTPSGWLWPATGRITNYLSVRHPLGIDISMIAGTPLVAAAGGQVVFAGGNPCCSYGSHVIIDHGDGYETLYAHLSRFAVENGQWVEAGQLIGWSGSTGRSTGPHLHFELRIDGVHRDPFNYLP